MGYKARESQNTSLLDVAFLGAFYPDAWCNGCGREQQAHSEVTIILFYRESKDLLKKKNAWVYVSL